MRMLRVSTLSAGAALLLGALLPPAHAEQIVLKVHHMLPATSNPHLNVIQPWCDKINKESNDRLKCQIYPAMQLGGTPPQLFDQVKDGVVDIVWTVPTYSAGRFSKSEVFELPFMAHDAKANQASGSMCRRTRWTSSRARGSFSCTCTTGRYRPTNGHRGPPGYFDARWATCDAAIGGYGQIRRRHRP